MELAYLHERCGKLKASSMLEDLNVTRNAYHADKEAIKKFVNQLQKAAGEKKFMTAEQFEKSILGALNG